ncbi:MAG TPA: RnfABCDGE type electron transport complex subunit B [Casimicrobiaceae bacterium]|jgi:electron transport complex protein RnfB|nr:RnfABCDGE type electron transport complex subunit B [Casimicrobiaceae bacterium]
MSDAKYTESIDALLPRESSPLSVARIDESVCIGCTLCIAACPVDAIVGAAKLIHTVITGHCIGCELCLPPCPVDCIAMRATGRKWTRSNTAETQDRFARRRARVVSIPAQLERSSAAPAAGADPEKMRRQAAVSAALRRARERRAQHARRTR